jgi:hypothetical protein
MFSVMCCGCFRVMGEDGKPIGKPSIGPVRLDQLAKHFKHLKGTAASFRSRAAADEGAGNFFWRAEGGNHRCPDCIAEEERTRQFWRSEQHGDYIEWPE